MSERMSMGLDSDPVNLSALGARKARGVAALQPDKRQKGTTHEAYEFLKGLQQFAQLPEGELEALGEASRFASVGSGEYIRNEGDENPGGFIVVSGRLAMMKTSSSGKELVVELLSARDILGLILALHPLPARLSIRAQAKSRLLYVPAASLAGLLTAHPDLYRDFSEHSLKRLFISYGVARGLAHDRVEARIAAIISNLATRFARPSSPDQNPVIDVTRQQIADLAGTTPETAIRVTRAMQRKGLLDMKHRGVITVLNRKALHAIAEE